MNDPKPKTRRPTRRLSAVLYVRTRPERKVQVEAWAHQHGMNTNEFVDYCVSVTMGEMDPIRPHRLFALTPGDAEEVRAQLKAHALEAKTAERTLRALLCDPARRASPETDRALREAADLAALAFERMVGLL